jgi:hypothetical protein
VGTWSKGTAKCGELSALEGEEGSFVIPQVYILIFMAPFIEMKIIIMIK